MLVKRVTSVGKKKVYDISVADAEHYILENGVVTHNTGIYYSADNIWIIGRRQDKEGTEILGYEFIINAEKSRFIKEKSKIPVRVSWEGGINKFSGLLELAVEGGFVHKGKKGRSIGYAHMNHETGEVEDKVFYEHETENAEFWDRYLKDKKFKDYVASVYAIPEDQKEVVIQEEDEDIDGE